ncbi:MAG: HTH domain-containing protein [Clostridia bacterium]|nr:HTH domain-containing protein [Clostridia bacterium]
MNAAERRNEIISILLVRHHITVKELAGEFDVTIRTIKNDIQALSFAYPIYTKPGVAGGIFMGGHYNPHINSLTPKELETLKELYERAEDRHRKVLAQIIHKYGPDKMEL